MCVSYIPSARKPYFVLKIQSDNTFLYGAFWQTVDSMLHSESELQVDLVNPTPPPSPNI